MQSYILVGCDLHDSTMLLKISANAGAVEQRSYENSAERRKGMLLDLKRRAFQHQAQIGFAYEASCLGFGLYDELTGQGIRCHVLAPTKIERSAKHRRCKTDEKDAARILEILRAHYLAEMGAMRRFKNRRQSGAFLGLVPSSNETGNADERKGHITHQGPARIRYILQVQEAS